MFQCQHFKNLVCVNDWNKVLSYNYVLKEKQTIIVICSISFVIIFSFALFKKSSIFIKINIIVKCIRVSVKMQLSITCWFPFVYYIKANIYSGKFQPVRWYGMFSFVLRKYILKTEENVPYHRTVPVETFRSGYWS